MLVEVNMFVPDEDLFQSVAPLTVILLYDRNGVDFGAKVAAKPLPFPLGPHKELSLFLST